MTPADHEHVRARHLRWPHGEAQLARSLDQWPEPWRSRPRRPARERRILAAQLLGWPGAIAVRLQCFTAGGASFFASAAATFTPLAGTTLELACAEPEPLLLGDELARLLETGAGLLPARPIGLLQIHDLRVHLVDHKPWAWRWCGALLARLACQDVLERSDEELAELAHELRLAAREDR